MESRMETYLNAAISGNTENLPKPISRIDFLLCELIKTLGDSGASIEEVEKIVTDKVAEIVADAPEDFNTLKELSDWIYTHEESAAAMNTAIQSKVDKEEGKSLISDSEITRLANVKNYDDTQVRADISSMNAAVKNDIVLNRTTLGMQCKNLLKNTAVTKTVNGVTFTVNDDKSITVSGKNTSSSTIFYTICQTGELSLEIGKTYIMTGCPANNKDDNGKTLCYLRADKTGGLIASDYGNGVTFSTSETSNPTYVLIWIDNNADFTDKPVTFYPMIRYADITDSTYEPYKENVDERLIENKSDIAINKTTLGYQCKNLFDWKNAVAVKSDGVTFNKTDNYISVTSLGAWASVAYKLPDIEIGVKYTFSATVSNLLKAASTVKMRLSYGSGGESPIIDMDLTDNGEYKASFIPTISTVYVLFYPNFSANGYTNSFTASDIMLRYADITDDTYEPYKENVNKRLIKNKSDIAVNKTTLGYQGKNLLKNTAVTTTINGVTFTVNSDSSITATQTTTSSGNATIKVATMTLKPGTYILTGDDEIRLPGFGAIRFYVGNTIYSSNKPHTFDTEVTIDVRLFVWKGVNINGSKTIYPMLRYADITDDTYEPYKESVDERLIENKSNIAINKSTLGYQCKNILNETEYLSSIASVSIGTFNISGNSITLTATGKDCYTKPHTSSDGGYRIPVEPDTDYILSWESDNTYAGLVYVFLNGDLRQQRLASNKDTKYLKFTTKSNTTFITIRLGVATSGNSITYSNIMLRYADILDNTYEPYQPSVQEQIVGAYFPMTAQKGIGDNTDLNTITELGNYICWSGSSASTMINCPTKTGGFRLIVTNKFHDCNHKSNIRYQWIIPNNQDSVLYYRRSFDTSTNSFGSWYSFGGTLIS